MDELFGLPAHPLVVHLPVVLLPLAVVGVAAMMARPAWYRLFRWPVLAIAAVGALGAVFAANSGEALEERVEDSASGAVREAIEEHAEAGETARTLAIVFLVAVAAYVVIPWWLERRSRRTTSTTEAAPGGAPSWVRVALMGFVALAAVGSLVTIVDAGHSGADSVWNELGSGDDEGD